MDFLSTFWRSFWSPLAYKNALTWKWKIFFYFLLICLFSSVLTSVAEYPKFKDFLNAQVKVALKDFKTFQIENFSVKTEDNQIHTYDLPDERGLLSISESKNPSTKDYLISLEGDKLVYASTIAPLADFVKAFNLNEELINVDKEKVFSFIDALESLYFFLATPLLFVFTLLSNFFYVIILSLAVYTMLLNSPLKLGYASAIKISVLAITPMVFFQSISGFFTLEDSAGFIYGIISIILAWYVVKKLPSYY